MNKLAFTLATVAALGLSTAAFAQTSTTTLHQLHSVFSPCSRRRMPRST